MSELTIRIPEEKPARLREKASACGVGAEEIVRTGIDRLLEGSEEDFETAMTYVLKKNEELYRRPA
ncbi:MAG: DNA-binding protein [Pseudomonadota bacterium]